MYAGIQEDDLKSKEKSLSTDELFYAKLKTRN